MTTDSATVRARSPRHASRASTAVAAVCAGLLVFGAAPAGAGTLTYASVNRPGPALTPTAAQLAASLTCSNAVGHSTKEPVLLVPGTAATFHSQWSWNFAVELSRHGIPWCGVTPPLRQLGDTQLAAEYDTYAIRYLYQHSGNRKIAIVGHSQGGMQPRWSLRFWPDTRAMVTDMVGISPDNQGATAERAVCSITGLAHTCPINFWQGATGSNFIQALNSGQQMFPGIDYTVIWSTSDELVQRQDTPLYGPGSYRWMTLQQVCAGHMADHILDGTVDPISWALTLDAITHAGPANPGRISPAVCQELTMPGVNPLSALEPAAEFAASVATAAATAPESSSEPPLACYVLAAGCTQ